jgi:tRNA1(Val) A37 N6-methylase TrmN6
MINLIVSSISNAYLMRFLSAQNSAFVGYEQDLSELIQGYEKFQNLVKIGEIEYKNTDKLLVFTCKYLGELTSRSSRKNQYEIAKKALKEDFKDGAVFVFYDDAGRFRFSFIRRNFGDKTNKFTPWKRYTYFVEPDAKTNRTFIERIGSCRFESLDAIQEAFSVEKLTKDFYKELSNWYFWAIKEATFPNNVKDDTDDQKYNPENVIRLITRLIFVWFLKQKGLVKPDLFQVEALTSILKDFDAESETQHNYYRAILQNLFFATLNQEIGQRSFAEDKGFLLNQKTYSIKSLYRYENEFKLETKQILELFSEIPFLNGGLFECLDNKEKEGKLYDWDGFSRNRKRQAKVPNHLFFAKEMRVDLSSEYNDKKMKAVKVSGIIEILNRYNFTIEENTPVEIEVALDPELLGKAFENLLGAYNPETHETARKQTGSFYTPREIVHYMVDESLVAYFKTKVPDVDEESLRLLISYDEQEVTLSKEQKERLIQATFNCKILDPACGSGAFPMGILQQMVHLLNKLDPENEHWFNVVMAQAMKDFEKADELNDEDKKEYIEEIEATFEKGLNYPDYSRKLYIIENCIYGVDIQSIAVQISKLRFFISLVCEQKKHSDYTHNYGIRPLPNLESKFVAANTLLCSNSKDEDKGLFNDDGIKKLLKELKIVRDRLFLVTNNTEKKSLREKDQLIRELIAREVKSLYSKHEDENKALYILEKERAERQLHLLDRTVERSSTSTVLFGESITKTYKPNLKLINELQKTIELASKKIEESGKYSRLEAVVELAKQLTSWNPYDQNQSSPFFDPEWMFGLPQVDGGYFDVIIGNPPYLRIQGIRESDSAFADLLVSNYKAATGSFDLYAIFTERAISLISHTGLVNFIMPVKWINAAFGKGLRSLLSANKYAHKIISFGAYQVFNASTYTGLHWFIRNSEELAYYELNKDLSTNVELAVYLNSLSNSNATKIQSQKLQTESWVLTIGDTAAILNKLDCQPRRIKDVFERIFCGLQTSKDDVYFLYECKEMHGTITGYSKHLESVVEIERGLVKPLLKGDDVHRYEKIQTDKFVIFPYKLENDTPVLYTEKELSSLYPMGYSYLKTCEEVLRGREKGRLQNDDYWYRYIYPKNLVLFAKEKLVAPDISLGGNFALDLEGAYYQTTTIYGYIKKAEVVESYKYWVALFNSRLCWWFLINTGTVLANNYFRYKPDYLNPFPIPASVRKNVEERIQLMVDQILVAKVNRDYSTAFSLEQQIDNLVYRLYNLTFEEVKVIDPEIENKITEEAYNAIEI